MTQRYNPMTPMKTHLYLLLSKRNDEYNRTQSVLIGRVKTRTQPRKQLYMLRH